MKSKNVSEAGIINIASKKLIVASKGFTLSTHKVEQTDETGKKHTVDVDELEICLKMRANHGKFPSPPGIWINKTNYRFINELDDVPVSYLRGEESGVCIFTCNKVIIIGVYDKEKISAGNCNMEIEKLGQSFLKVNY